MERLPLLAMLRESAKVEMVGLIALARRQMERQRGQGLGIVERLLPKIDFFSILAGDHAPLIE
ncbi:hypothetical protein [Roseibacillus persicicus]|uniref:Uncharacterized protein n=1 Tax=Roseibacillus persicicus TaxID=454148 RepID=A0A918TWC0_9BACT|nr:hypothetical protein [Roseibacillus persicicus]GHC66130.1 hypothetical protein GCM10007100_37470 [Roseibacillus persicicus]